MAWTIKVGEQYFVGRCSTPTGGKSLTKELLFAKIYHGFSNAANMARSLQSRVNEAKARNRPGITLNCGRRLVDVPTNTPIVILEV
jgi:hypothetical protein